jgi:hypothetical protein
MLCVPLSFTVIVNVDVSSVVGVPLIAPVLASRVSPAGKLPDVTLHV